MKVIDGNHRVAALKASDKEAGRPPSMVMVRVHDPMEVSMTKMVAEGKLVTMCSCYECSCVQYVQRSTWYDLKQVACVCVSTYLLEVCFKTR